MLAKYILNILIALDQLLNTILFGDPDETISSRVGKRRHLRGWKQLSWLIDKLFFWEKYHTENSIEKDEGRDDLFK